MVSWHNRSRTLISSVMVRKLWRTSRW